MDHFHLNVSIAFWVSVSSPSLGPGWATRSFQSPWPPLRSQLLRFCTFWIPMWHCHWRFYLKPQVPLAITLEFLFEPYEKCDLFCSWWCGTPQSPQHSHHSHQVGWISLYLVGDEGHGEGTLTLCYLQQVLWGPGSRCSQVSHFLLTWSAGWDNGIGWSCQSAGI